MLDIHLGDRPLGEPPPSFGWRPRVTIRGLMIATAAVAVAIWVGQQYQMILVSGCYLIVPTILGFLAWRAARNRPTLALGTAGVVAVPASGITAWLCVQPLPMVGQILPAVVAGSVTPVLIGCVVAWWGSDHPRGWTSRRIAGQALILLCAGLPGSMAATFWPLHLAFGLARPEMIRLAERVGRGEKVPFPRSVGAYTVVGILVSPRRNGNLAILLDDDPAGPVGFVRILDASDLIADQLRPHPTDYRISLGEGWSYMVED